MNIFDPDNLNRMKKMSKSMPETGGKTRKSRKERIAQAMANYAAAPEGLRTSEEVRDVKRKRGLYADKARPGTELLLGRTPGPKRSGRMHLSDRSRQVSAKGAAYTHRVKPGSERRLTGQTNASSRWRVDPGDNQKGRKSLLMPVGHDTQPDGRNVI